MRRRWVAVQSCWWLVVVVEVVKVNWGWWPKRQSTDPCHGRAMEREQELAQARATGGMGGEDPSRNESAHLRREGWIEGAGMQTVSSVEPGRV